MFSLYRSLLYLYPPAHRYEYGEEMMAVFVELETETWKKGALARGLFCAREVKGLLGGALLEHVRTIAGAHRPSPFFSRRLTVRTEFRFPKATATLMTIILAAIVMAIEKAKAIQASIPYSNPHVGPIQPAQFTLLPTLLLIMAFACMSGGIGWAILFALHRSGVHRLAEFDPSGDQGSGRGMSV